MRALLVIYDNNSYMSYFPLGAAYVVAALRVAGVDVDVYDQQLMHAPDENLTKYLDDNKYDVVGLGFVAGYYQYRKAIALSRAINHSKNRPFFVLAGHGPSPEPAYFLKKLNADAVVMGEGEVTVVELMSALSAKLPLSTIDGLAYRDGSDVVINSRRKLIKEIDSIVWPAHDMFSMQYYRMERMPHSKPSDFVGRVLSGRGCNYSCSFCYRMDKGLRIRSNESIIAEVVFLKKKYGINYIMFADELLMSSPARVESLCLSFIERKLDIRWSCSGRLNWATTELLRLMKKAGCVFVNYGIESFDDAVLKAMRKSLTCDQIISGVEATLAAGVSPGYNIIFGNIGDTSETLKKGVDFLLKYDDGAQLRTIRPVTPYPGSPLYYYAIEQGLLGGVEDFYESKHTNSDLITVNFTEMSDDDFYSCLYDANMRLLKNYHSRVSQHIESQLKDLYVYRDSSFRGFRQK